MKCPRLSILDTYPIAIHETNALMFQRCEECLVFSFFIYNPANCLLFLETSPNIFNNQWSSA